MRLQKMHWAQRLSLRERLCHAGGLRSICSLLYLMSHETADLRARNQDGGKIKCESKRPPAQQPQVLRLRPARVNCFIRQTQLMGFSCGRASSSPLARERFSTCCQKGLYSLDRCVCASVVEGLFVGDSGGGVGQAASRSRVRLL